MVYIISKIRLVASTQKALGSLYRWIDMQWQHTWIMACSPLHEVNEVPDVQPYSVVTSESHNSY